MRNKNMKVQVVLLCLLILANFIAQIPYYLHLYYNPGNLLASAKGVLILGFVLAFFLLASFLLFKRTVLGYRLMLVFLSVEFLFYLWNTTVDVIHGYGPFYHLNNPDLLLRGVFAVGYVNLFASGYFLCLLLLKRTYFFNTQEKENALKEYSV